jgi:hypothetical protein
MKIARQFLTMISSILFTSSFSHGGQTTATTATSTSGPPKIPTSMAGAQICIELAYCDKALELAEALDPRDGLVLADKIIGYGPAVARNTTAEVLMLGAAKLKQHVCAQAKRDMSDLTSTGLDGGPLVDIIDSACELAEAVDLLDALHLADEILSYGPASARHPIAILLILVADRDTTDYLYLQNIKNCKTALERKPCRDKYFSEFTFGNEYQTSGSPTESIDSTGSGSATNSTAPPPADAPTGPHDDG